jgi:hypothetical protein
MYEYNTRQRIDRSSTPAACRGCMFVHKKSRIFLTILNLIKTLWRQAAMHMEIQMNVNMYLRQAVWMVMAASARQMSLLSWM